MDHMAYIVCENCGGYYHLMEGESLNDFDSCECGGKLYLLEYGEDGKVKSPKYICEYCGNQNSIYAAFCLGCGQILTSTKNFSGYSEAKNSFKPKTHIFAGVTIMLSLILLGMFAVI